MEKAKVGKKRLFKFVRKVVGIGFLAFFTAVSIFGFNSQSQAKTFTMVTEYEAKSMDPNDISDYGRIYVRANMYDGLTRYQGFPAVLEPWLAESWEAASEAKEWTFHLRKGVRFHDGSEMTAEDVVYSVEKLLHGGKGIAGTMSKFVKPGATEPVDKYTVRFHLTQPCSLFDGLTQSIFVLNKNVLKRHEENGDYGNKWLAIHGSRLGKNGVGTGAYTLTEWKPGNYLTFEKFSDFWKKWNQPHMKDVRVEIVYENATRIIGLRKGRYHYWNMPLTYDTVQTLMKSPLLQELHRPFPKLEYIHLNNRKPPTNDIHFRKALCYALDYETLIDGVLHGYVERCIGYIPPAIIGSLDPRKDWHYTYDLDKAREELAKCEVDYKKYEPLEIQLFDTPELTTMGEMLLVALQKLGIKGRFKIVTWPTWCELASKPETAPLIAPIGLSPYYLDPDHYSRVVDSRGFGTHMGTSWYENPKIEEMHMKALATPNKEERIELYKQAQRIELQDASHVWVSQWNYHNALNKDIGGLENYSPYGALQEFREIYFKSEWK